MRRIWVVAVAGAMALGVLGLDPASARNVADDQGFCKKQGPSSCAGGSECSGGHILDLPRGIAKKCK